MEKNTPVVTIADLVPGIEADFFAILAVKEHRNTKDGKPYFRVEFRDSQRSEIIPIWMDSRFFEECKTQWEPGNYYKIRATLRPSQKFGPQLEIHKIRPATEADRAEGFDPKRCRPCSRYEPEAMYDEVLDLAKKHIVMDKDVEKLPSSVTPQQIQQLQTRNRQLLELITLIFKDNRDVLLEAAAAKYHHHTYFGGLLEHTLSVTKIAIFLADHFLQDWKNSPQQRGALSKPLVVAGAILHDIGKIREQKCEIATSQYTMEGMMIGHIVLGRDFVRDYGQRVKLDLITQTHLEHIILSHQRLSEWGSPKPPMSLEAVLVHHADSSDALVGCHFAVLQQDESDGPLTSRKNMLGYNLFRNGEMF